MNQNLASSVRKPQGLGSFFGGFKSGAMSGALMMGIFGIVSLTGLVTFPGLAIAAGTMLTTGLFSGTMSIMKSGKPQHAPAPVQAPHTGRTAPAVSQELAPQQSVAVEQSAAPKQNWTDRVGQRDSRVQQILDNGSLSDKDRASAILAARENADQSVSR